MCTGEKEAIVAKVKAANALADQMYDGFKTDRDNLVKAYDTAKEVKDLVQLKCRTISETDINFCFRGFDRIRETEFSIEQYENVLKEAISNYIQKVKEQIHKFHNEGPDYVSSTAFIKRTLKNVIMYTKTRLNVPIPIMKDYLNAAYDENKSAAPKQVIAAQAVVTEIENVELVAAEKAEKAAAEKAAAEKAAAEKAAAEKAAAEKALESIHIEAVIKYNKQPINISFDKDQKNNLINSNLGCWDKLDGQPVIITKVKLPSDIQAAALGEPTWLFPATICGYAFKQNIQPSTTVSFEENKNIYGLKFARV